MNWKKNKQKEDTQIHFLILFYVMVVEIFLARPGPLLVPNNWSLRHKNYKKSSDTQILDRATVTCYDCSRKFSEDFLTHAQFKDTNMRAITLNT